MISKIYSVYDIGASTIHYGFFDFNKEIGYFYPIDGGVIPCNYRDIMINAYLLNSTYSYKRGCNIVKNDDVFNKLQCLIEKDEILRKIDFGKKQTHENKKRRI